MCTAPEQKATSLMERLLLLMSVLPQALFTLVGCHFVLLSFLSAWHKMILVFVPFLTEKDGLTIILSPSDTSRLLLVQRDRYPIVLLFQTARARAFFHPC